MARKHRRTVSTDIAKARRRIEHWRKTRKKRSPMPEDLWDSAVALARAHGLYPISKALRLSYDSLKSRVATTPGNGRSDRGFIEVSPAQLIGPPEPTGPVVEFSDADGAKLRICLTGRSDLDVVGLADAFWGHRP